MWDVNVRKRIAKCFEVDIAISQQRGAANLDEEREYYEKIGRLRTHLVHFFKSKVSPYKSCADLYSPLLMLVDSEETAAAAAAVHIRSDEESSSAVTPTASNQLYRNISFSGVVGPLNKFQTSGKIFGD